MTPGDAADAFQAAFQCAVLAQRLNEILAASRMKSALPADDGAQRYLINPYGSDEYLGRNSKHPSQRLH